MNTHFAIALHALILLARAPGQTLTSEALAEALETNPVFLRRVLGALRKAGLLEMRRGAGGGILLCEPPERVPLATVYQAVQGDRPLLPLHRAPEGAGTVPWVLQTHFEEVESRVLRHLERYTVRDLVDDVRR